MNIEIKNLTYIYNLYENVKEYALKDINLFIKDNEFISIIGETGSGKSTLIKHLNGLLKPYEGEVIVDGKNIYDKDYDLNKLKFKIGLVFQYPEYQLFEETVIKDVMFGAINKGLKETEAREKAKTILKKLNLNEEYFDKLPFLLSGGEKRKIAIAGILIMEPEVLVFDEPEAGLDPKSKNELFKMLLDLKKVGKTIIIVTHNLETAIEYSDRIVLMRKGEVLKVGELYEIFEDNSLLEKANIFLPDQIILRNALSKKYKDFDKRNVRQIDIENQIVKIKSHD